MADPSDLFQKIGLKINHPIAPAIGGFGLAGVQLIGIHGYDGMGGGHVLRAAITKTFGSGFYRANAECFMCVRLKGVT